MEKTALVEKCKSLKKMPLSMQILEIEQMYINASGDYAAALRKHRDTGVHKVTPRDCPSHWTDHEKEHYCWEAGLYAELSEDEFETAIRRGERSFKLTRNHMRKVCQKARKLRQRKERAGIVTLDSKSVQIYTGNIYEIETLRQGIADAVITDPPYEDAGLPLWSELVQFSGRTLKKGGWLLAMSGVRFLPQVFKNMESAASEAGLQYVHTICVRTTGGMSSSVWIGRDNAVNSDWKPVLVYSKGTPAKWPDRFRDVIASDETEAKLAKEDHDWGQPTTVFDALVEHFTKPKDLVVDPFLGSGTTAESAYNFGRRFEGFDIDESNVKIATGRVVKCQK